MLGDSQMKLSEPQKPRNKGYKTAVFKVNTFRSAQLHYVGWLAQIILEETKASLERDFCQISLHGVVTIVDDRVVPLQTS